MHRIDGTLTRWQDDRGFGFIAPAQGGSEVFVHVSAFPRDGRRPRVGERLSFEVEVDERGRKRAVRVVCPERPAAPTRRTAERRPPRAGGILRKLGWLPVAIALVYGYGQYQGQGGTPSRSAAAERAAAPTPAFRCDGRTHCSQMTSCAEATYFLQNCPGTQMDGNGDGVPCEQQWCRGR
ncbi:MAG: cold shock domain-containing protein [Rhodocyclaceae bacterium]|nr:cold shock domain-containing protein [Rhodocyclaceae bacterium]